MKVLIIFAHPDDETVACAGTIHQLVELKHEVNIISVTDGGEGEFPPHLKEAVLQAGGIGAYRRQEFNQVCQLLGAKHHQILNYQDGQINNIMVWGKLVDDLVKEINKIKPDLLITSDHTGWYYHLDHVGVSIATTIAFHKAKHKTPLFMLSHFRPMTDLNQRWPYNFSPQMPVTHAVTVNDVKFKLRALDCHLSQNLKVVCDYVLQNQPHQEFYELAFVRSNNKKLINKFGIFELVN